MTKQELVEKLAEAQKRRNVSKAAAFDVVESLFENLGLAIRRGRRFSYPGFGTFAVRRRKERRGRNPQTGQEIQVPPAKAVVFRICSRLKERLNAAQAR